MDVQDFKQGSVPSDHAPALSLSSHWGRPAVGKSLLAVSARLSASSSSSAFSSSPQSIAAHLLSSSRPVPLPIPPGRAVSSRNPSRRPRPSRQPKNLTVSAVSPRPERIGNPLLDDDWSRRLVGLVRQWQDDQWPPPDVKESHTPLRMLESMHAPEFSRPRCRDLALQRSSSNDRLCAIRKH